MRAESGSIVQTADDPRLPQVLDRRGVARSRYFGIESVRLRFANGSEREFERIAAPPNAGTVIVVAIPAPGQVLLIREYAVGLERYELGLPMGGVDPGETVLEAASRELREETGYAARNLVSLGTLSLAPCIFSYQAHIVLATDLIADASGGGDEPELPEVTCVPIADIGSMVVRRELSEARSLAALFIARERLEAEASGLIDPVRSARVVSTVQVAASG